MRDLRLWLLIAIGLGLVVGTGTDLVHHLGCPALEPSTVRVLLLDNSLNRPIYQPLHQWKRYLGDVPVDAVHMPSGERVESLDAYSHVILTGSTASLVDPPDWAETEADVVREAAALGLSILGSCFGHQMLVYALSGPEYVRRAAEPEIGWVAIEMSGDDRLFAGVPNPWHAFAWHYDEVVALPAPWRVLGSTALCDAAVIRFGDALIWGLQVHPETKPVEAKALLFLQKVFFDWRSQALCSALLQRPQDDKIIGNIVDRFLGRD